MLYPTELLGRMTASIYAFYAICQYEIPAKSRISLTRFSETLRQNQVVRRSDQNLNAEVYLINRKRMHYE